jgi:hypothetical protein
MYQLAVETSVSAAAGLHDLPGAETAATANSDIASFLPVARVLLAQTAINPIAILA